MCTAVQPLYSVIVEILGVYVIQTADISVALVLECCPVEGCGFLDGESVRFGFVEGLGDSGSVPSDLLRYTTGFALAGISPIKRANSHLPNVDACSSQSIALYSDGLCAPLPTRSSG